MTKVVFHLKVIRSLCSHIWNGPVNANGLGFQLCPLFIFRKREGRWSDVHGHRIGSIALLDLGPDSGPAPVLPTHAKPKGRRDDLLGRDLPSAHNGIAGPESIAWRGAAPRDRKGFLLGRRRRRPREECRKREMLTRQGGAEKKKKEARRSPKTTMHTSGFTRTTRIKNRVWAKKDDRNRTLRRCLITNGPADESGEKEDDK